jgi:DNA-binding NtrC family response regulator
MSRYNQPKRTMHLESEPDDPEWIKKIADSIKASKIPIEFAYNPPEFTKEIIYRLGYPKKRALKIAREQGMTQATYKRFLAAIKFYKIPKEKMSEPLLRQLYIEKSNSVADIARMAGTTRQTIYRLLDKYGLREEKDGNL